MRVLLLIGLLGHCHFATRQICFDHKKFRVVDCPQLDLPLQDDDGLVPGGGGGAPPGGQRPPHDLPHQDDDGVGPGGGGGGGGPPGGQRSPSGAEAEAAGLTSDLEDLGGGAAAEELDLKQINASLSDISTRYSDIEIFRVKMLDLFKSYLDQQKSINRELDDLSARIVKLRQRMSDGKKQFRNMFLGKTSENFRFLV